MASIELVAPAGGPDMFLAAVEAGANAVYAGLRIAGGHSDWHSFTPVELSSLITHAHDKNVAVHVYVDSVLLEDELTGFLDPLVSVISQGVDLLVVQDLGLLSLLKRHFPEQPVQAGTGFGVHNEDGVRFLLNHGADRIALIPEVHVNDIGRIVQATGAHVEIQVHGPLGFCMNGQCLFSSFADGSSANRGNCTRPCYAMFQDRGKTERVFATRELNTTTILPRLARSGARSFRIGGRSMTHDKVPGVIRDYRRAFRQANETRDGHSSERRGPGRRREQPTTVGYYLGGKTDLLDPGINVNRSQYVGTIQKMFQDTVGITPDKTLRLGDRIFIRTSEGHESAPFTIKEIYLRNRRVRSSRPGEMVRVRVPRVFEKGDEIHRLPSASRGEEKKSRENRGVSVSHQPLNLKVEWQPGQVAFSTVLSSIAFSNSYEFTPAKEAVKVDMSVRQYLEPPRSSPFVLGELEVEGEAKPGPSEWELKALVTQFYRAAEEEVHVRRSRTIDKMADDIRCNTTEPVDVPETCRFRVSLHSAELLRNLDNSADVLWSLRISPRRFESLCKSVEESDVDWSNVVLELPPWLWQGEREEFSNMIRQIAENEPGGWVVETPGQITMLRLLLGESSGPRSLIMVSTRGRCYNSLTVRSLVDRGADRVCLSVEDGRSNWLKILERTGAGRIEVPVFGHVALFTSRSRPQHLRDGAELEMINGPQVIYRKRESWSEVRSKTPFSVSTELGSLRNSGFRLFHVDLREGFTDAADCQKALSCVKNSESIGQTSSFNYRKGIV